MTYQEQLHSAAKTREKIESQPYLLPLYISLAEEYAALAYPDLAAGAAYKALLLSDAIRDEDDEYHERAVESLAEVLPDYAPKDESNVVNKDDEDEVVFRVQSYVSASLLPKVYHTLISSLLRCSCYQSAWQYCLQAKKSFGEDTSQAVTRDLEAAIKEDVAKYGGTNDDVKPDDASTWPDAGFVRRERYPWNDFEPDRFAELEAINELMRQVAPKLEVLAVDLPDLTAEPVHGTLPVSKQLGVFAKETIAPGEILLEENTLLTGTNKLQDALCDACNADLPELASADANTVVSCPDCEVVFCSEKCMEDALACYHPALCDKDVEAIASDLPAAQAADALYSRLLLRALAMAETQQCHPLQLNEIKYIWADFHNFPITDFETAQAAPRTLPFSFEYNIRLPFHMLEKMDIDIFANPQYDVWVFNTLYAKFRGTASARLSGRGGPARGPEVSAVHPMWCLANSSCDPNVSWEWGGSIKFWAREQRTEWRDAEGEARRPNSPGIGKGEEVLNHYCDVDLPVHERRAWARGALGGDCRCERCVWEAGEPASKV